MSDIQIHKKGKLYNKHTNYYDCCQDKKCNKRGVGGSFGYHKCCRKGGCRTTPVKKELTYWNSNAKWPKSNSTITLKQKGTPASKPKPAPKPAPKPVAKAPKPPAPKPVAKAKSKAQIALEKKRKYNKERQRYQRSLLGKLGVSYF